MIKEKTLGSNHPSVATSLDNLATLDRNTGRERAALPWSNGLQRSRRPNAEIEEWPCQRVLATRSSCPPSRPSRNRSR